MKSKRKPLVKQLTIPEVSLTEAEMQMSFYRHYCQRYELMATNLYLGWCGGEMDIFGMRKSGFVDEIEIKLSVSDFKADFKKTITVREDHEAYFPGGCTWSPAWKSKHEALKDGEHSCNYFSFFLPVDLVDK